LGFPEGAETCFDAKNLWRQCPSLLTKKRVSGRFSLRGKREERKKILEKDWGFDDPSLSYEKSSALGEKGRRDTYNRL